LHAARLEVGHIEFLQRNHREMELLAWTVSAEMDTLRSAFSERTLRNSEMTLVSSKYIGTNQPPARINAKQCSFVATLSR
jgi:hypothetical protein